MIRIRLPDSTEATLQARRWHSESARLERLLNAMLSPWGTHDVDGELQEARIASKVLGAEIVEQDDPLAGG